MQQFEPSIIGAYYPFTADDCAGVGFTSKLKSDEQSSLDKTGERQGTLIGATDHAAQTGTAPPGAELSASHSTGTSGDSPAGYTLSPAGSQRSDVLDAQWAQQVFRAFDTDGRGLLDAPQLACALASIGIRLPVDLVCAAMRAHAATAAAGSATAQGGERIDIAGFQVLAWRLARVGDLSAAAGSSSQSTPPLLPRPTPLKEVLAPSSLALPIPLCQERTGNEAAARPPV
jgi:hypothetical protein